MRQPLTVAQQQVHRAPDGVQHLHEQRSFPEGQQTRPVRDLDLALDHRLGPQRTGRYVDGHSCRATSRLPAR